MLYTAESVTSGHPDKVCDQISDAILDEYLKQDSKSRVAVETLGAHGLIVIGGEVTSRGKVDAEKIARQVYKYIGHPEKPKVLVNIVSQSPDIAQGVDTGGAGDQGIMYGYATNETKEYLPLPVVLAHKLTSGLEKLRRTNKKFWWLKPDGKSQVTVENDRVKTVLISCQHDEKISQEEIKKLLTKYLIRPVIGKGDYEILVNPTGKFVYGGIYADTGLTGRKLMVDTYGGLISHGGGAFSGKDPTKVDRSGAYMCRWVAKNLVANGYAKKCIVSVAYAIGRAEPLMVEVDSFGTGNHQKARSTALKNFDFKPLVIIDRLKLRRPIYLPTAAYGHFGRPGFPWEQIIKI